MKFPLHTNTLDNMKVYSVARAYTADDVICNITDNEVFTDREEAEVYLRQERDKTLNGEEEGEVWSTYEDEPNVFRGYAYDRDEVAIRVTEVDLKVKVRVGVLTWRDPDNNGYVGTWKEADLETALKSHFADNYTEHYGKGDAEYLTISDREEYARYMSGHLLTAQEAEDPNDGETLYELHYSEVEI